MADLMTRSTALISTYMANLVLLFFV